MIESPRFPLTVNFGARFGPQTSTDIVETEGGKEWRMQNWDYPLQRGSVSLRGATAARMAVLRQWVYATHGKADVFRVKDVNDFAVPDVNGSGALVQVAGSVYQMVKRYTRGSAYGDRAIQKPVVGATAIYKNAVLQLLTTHYALDESTGLVTFVTPPVTSPPDALTWTGQFDIAMRFDVDVVEFETLARADGGYHQGVDELPLVEVRI